MRRVRVTSRVRMPEGVIEAGEEISVTEEDAVDLIEIGVAEPLDDDEAPAMQSALDVLRAMDDDRFAEVFADVLRIAESRGYPGLNEAGAEAVLGGALDVLRRATPGRVREFFRAMANDEEIAAKIDSEVSRQEKLIAAIVGLDPENRDHWIADGRPSTKAIEAATGLDEVSAAERDAAWEEFEKAKREG